MTLQLRRSLAFLVGNAVVSVAYVMVVVFAFASAPGWNPEDRVWWAIVILAYIPAQLLLRLLIQIILAVANEAQGRKEQVDLEDELDKAIDYRSTRLGSLVFMAALFAALASQAFGQPVSAFFSLIAGGMVLSGLTGDVASLVLYRRGF